jgi:hypothetical protein
MAIAVDRRSSTAAQARRAVDEVLKVAQSSQGRATVSGGSKPHVTITKSVMDYNDTYLRAMLSGIEFATHGHFAQGREAVGTTEWMLRSRLVDVTVRASKGLG